MKTALKRVASLLLALIMILEVVAPGVVEARSAGQNRATVSDEEFIPPDGNRIDPDQNAGSHLPNFIDPDDDGYYTPPQKAPARPAQNAPAQAAPKQGNEDNAAADVDVSEERAPKPLIEDEAKSGKSELELEFDQEMERARVAASPMNPDGIEGKKFTILTRFDTSTRSGAIQPGQFFEIHLDKELTVTKATLAGLEPIRDGNRDLTDKPTYENNVLKYRIKTTINKDIKVPIKIDVDYNTDNIDPNAKQFTVTNSVSGLGVVDPKPLLPVVVDSNGNMLSTIVEPNQKDVVQIIDYGEDYKVNIKAFGVPEVENKEITKINWKVLVSSNKKLADLGYAMNFTAVEGSGLGEITDLKAFDKDHLEIDGEKYDQNTIHNQLGIVDSRHHTLANKNVTELYYTFSTKVTEKQGSYMLDLSGILKEKNKVGAVRLILPDGYDQGRIEEATPTRVGMNNRTTIMGKFASEKTAQWTITDAVSSGDANKGLPLASRELSDNQTVLNNRAASYKIDPTTGQMVVGTPAHRVGGNTLPAEKSNPSGSQSVGTIAVYKVDTKLDNPNDPERYSIDALFISKYQDLRVFQEWNLATNATIPAENFIVRDESGNEIKTHYERAVDNGNERNFTIPNVRKWKFDGNGELKAIDPTIEQSFDPYGEKPYYRYWENQNYYRPDDKYFHMHNSAVRDGKARAGFSVLKIDGKDLKTKLAGAEYTLMGRGLWEDQPNGELKAVTDKNGIITFNNIPEGSYTLVENKAPQGYKLDGASKIVTIDEQGKVSVTGPNATLSGGTSQIIRHDRYPSYMNAMHYGKIENGQLSFFIYLKPEPNADGNSTNKDTRLNISIPGVDLKDSNVVAYNVNPWYRYTFLNAMKNQSAGGMSNLGYSVINDGDYNEITGAPIAADPYTGDGGYQIKFPKERFNGDWGYLVKVTAPVKDATEAIVSYDWLTDNNRTADEAMLRQKATIREVQPGTADALITITNEAYPKQKIGMTKVDDAGKPLPGATIALKDTKDNIIKTLVTDNKGEVNFGEYSPGTYILEEIKAPDKHMLTNVIFVVTVGEDGKVTYKAKYKNSDGNPRPGKDYFIETSEDGEGTINAITNVVQNLTVNENEPGDIGTKTNVWEAYRFESLKYTATITLGSFAKNQNFSIQFDKNLDFTQYVKEFPKAKDKAGNVVADPYFDFNTNRLTYVFTTNAEGATVDLEINGIIPSKYYATENGTKDYTITVPGAQGTYTKTFPIASDYGYYDTAFGIPSQSYYFKDIYTDANDDIYVTALAYYNPLADYTGGSKTLQFNWLTTDYGGGANNIVRWPARGYKPAYELQNVKIYKTYPDTYKLGDSTYNRNMPLSYGVRPGQDTLKYSLVYKQNIDPRYKLTDSQNGFRMIYEPNQIQTSGTINQKSPLKITMPGISKANEGYLIEQTFKVVDKENWKNKWRAFYMSNGSLESGFANKPVIGDATVDQTGQEIPKFYKEIVKLVNHSYEPGKFKIHKVDAATGATLNGAYFTLYDSNGKAVAEKSSTIDGVIQEGPKKGQPNISPVYFEDLEPGNYTLKETKAPDGFQASNKTWQISVDSNGVVTIVEQNAAGGTSSVKGDNIYYTVTNTPKPTEGSFQIYKKSDKGAPLKGAKFKITELVDKQPTGPSGIGETDKDGRIVAFKGNQNETYKLLPNKSYLVEEVTPPAGYQKTDKKWVVRVDKDGKTKVYDYVDVSAGQGDLPDYITETGTKWVDVANRDKTGWATDDNRQNSYVDNRSDPYKMGTRIIAINKDKNYVIQRYVINPEGKQLGNLTAYIHREKPWDDNMDWYAGNEEFHIYKLDKPVTGNVEDIHLSNYNLTEINMTPEKVTMSGGQRAKLDLTAHNDAPIVIDVKVPYKNLYGGVGTGMDLYNDTKQGTNIAWKSDYYERVASIKEGDAIDTSASGNIYGSYISEGSLEVVNEPTRHQFTLKKVKTGEGTAIKGAAFKIRGPIDPEKPDDENTPVRTLHTGDDGEITFDNLLPGKYTVVESEPAPGYKPTDTVWTVTIDDDGKVYIKDNSGSNPAPATPATWSIEGEPTAPVGQMSRSAILDDFLAPFGAAEDESAETTQAKAAPAEETAAPEEMSASSVAAEAGEPIADQISRTAVLDNFLTTFGANAGLELGEENVPSPVGAESDWETIDPNRSKGFSEGSDMANDNGAPVVTKMMEINKVDNQLKQSFIFSPSPFGNANREIQIHRQPEYDLNKADIVQVSFYTVSGNTFETMGQKVPQNIRYNVKRKSGNGPNRIFATIPSRITGPILVEVTVKYDQNKGVGLGTNYNSNTGASYDNKSWLAHSYASESGINYKHTFKVVQVPNGTIWVEAINAAQGEIVDLGATPKEGYQLARFIVTDANGHEIPVNNKKFTMPDSDVTVTAEFEKKAPQPTTHTITVKANPEGSGTVKASPKSAVKGEQIRITASANDGYDYAGITATTVDGKPVTIEGGSLFTMPDADVIVTANFTPVAPQPTKHKIEIFTSAGGEVTAVPTTASKGEKVTLDVKPDANYKLKSLSVTDQQGSVPVENNTFFMRDSDVTVTATFEKETAPQPKPHAITVNAPAEGGTISANKESAVAGEIVKLTVEAKEGYKLKSLTAGGQAIPVAGPYEFTMPDSDVTVTAVFEKETASEGKGTEIKPGQYARIENEQKGIPLKIFKENTIGKVLPEAEFTLEKLDEHGKVVENSLVKGTTNEKGELTFMKGGNEYLLTVGDYRLTEVKPRSGYKVPPAPWKITVFEKDGQLKAQYYGPEKTPTTFVNDDTGKVAGLKRNEQTGDTESLNNGIEYASRVTNINPTATTTHLGSLDGEESQVGTYVQRLYVDTRKYNGASDKINVQIVPRDEREEVDIPGKSPYVTKQGVKTAYYTVYKLDQEPGNLDEAISTYDLSKPGVKMVKTARWRPFDWGFDEDQLNLDKGGIYMIDVEGFYDQDIVDKKEIALNFNFYDGAREFQEKDANGNWKSFPGASYQGGNIANGLTKDTAAGQEQRGKYPRWLGKENGRIWPPLKNPVTAATSIDIRPLYTSDSPNDIPQKGMTITNEEETYNITFVKLGYDKDPVTQANNRLEGGVFKLQEKVAGDYEDIKGSYVASAFNGYFGFRGLKPGRYRLIEVSPPKDHKPIQGTILEMTISHKKGELDPGTGTITPDRGQITLEYDKNAQGILPYEPEKATDKDGKLIDFVTSGTAKNMGKVINHIPGKGKVTVEKVDEKGGALKEGAVFTLTQLGDDGKSTGISGDYKIGEDGKVSIDGLPIGKYRLVEKTPHPGHKNLNQEWNFTVGGEGLDPYVNDSSKPTGTDLTDKISFVKSNDATKPNPKISLRRYRSDYQASETIIHPHKAESIDIQSDFTIDPGTTVSPGDYFKVKLSPSIDLEGIYKNRTVGNLDIFADGVGTIAKGTYDKDTNTITYTFTRYAEQYTLLNFKTSLAAWINLDKILTSSYRDVGIGLVGKNLNTKQFYVKYDIPSETSYHWTNTGKESGTLNLTGKIYEMDPDTGHFVQYYYINRYAVEGFVPSTFHYTSNKNLKDVNVSIQGLRDNSANMNLNNPNNNRNIYMPESFAVPEGMDNRWTVWNPDQFDNLKAGKPIAYTFGYGQYDSMTRWDSYLVKITGTIEIDPEDKDAAKGFETTGLMLDRYSNIINARYDQAYFTENKTTAEAKLEIQAVNPKNKIRFKKVDTDGNPIEGAVFKVTYKSSKDGDYGTIISQESKKSGKDGIFEFDKLIKGYYQLEEVKAADGYLGNKGPVLRFRVDDEGRIWREVKGQGNKTEEIEETGEIPIRVVNHKPIELHKKDANDKDKFLPGAEFDVYYKNEATGKYEEYKVEGDNGKKVTYHVAVGDKAPDLGKVKLNLSKAGDYALKETKAPEGYALPGGYVKEFSLGDQGLFLKEKGFQGDKIKKQDGGTDKNTSFVVAEKKTANGDSFDTYLVINPDHKERSYPDESYAQFHYKESGAQTITGTRIDKDGKEETLTFDTTYPDPDKYPTVNLYDLSNKHKIESTDTIVLKLSTSLKDSDENTEATITTAVKDSTGLKEATYKMKPADLPLSEGKTITEILGHPKFDTPKPKDYDTNEEAKAKYDKAVAAYNADKEAYLNKYRGEFYVKDEKDVKAVEVLNTKGVYPFTGGFGPHRWIVIIGAVIAAVAAEEYIRRKRTSAPKGGA